MKCKGKYCGTSVAMSSCVPNSEGSIPEDVAFGQGLEVRLREDVLRRGEYEAAEAGNMDSGFETVRILFG